MTGQYTLRQGFSNWGTRDIFTVYAINFILPALRAIFHNSDFNVYAREKFELTKRSVQGLNHHASTLPHLQLWTLRVMKNKFNVILSFDGVCLSKTLSRTDLFLRVNCVKLCDVWKRPVYFTPHCFKSYVIHADKSKGCAIKESLRIPAIHNALAAIG